MQEIHNCNNEGELSGLARQLLSKYPQSRIFAFFGELGAGKTTFIKAICASLGIQDDVTSPTFSIVNEYIKNDGRRLYHFDFYRLKSAEEAYDLGYEDYFFSGFYCFIEWPERIEELLPPNVVRVMFEVDFENNSRRIHF